MTCVWLLPAAGRRRGRDTHPFLRASTGSGQGLGSFSFGDSEIAGVGFALGGTAPAPEWLPTMLVTLTCCSIDAERGPWAATPNPLALIKQTRFPLKTFLFLLKDKSDSQVPNGVDSRELSLSVTQLGPAAVQGP